MSWRGLWFLSGRKLGQYADKELLKSLFQNKTPDLSLKYILIQVHDHQETQKTIVPINDATLSAAYETKRQYKAKKQYHNSFKQLNAPTDWCSY